MPRQPATWVACAAIGLSLATGARAIVNQVTGAQIQNRSITGVDIRAGSLKSTDLAAGAANHITIAGGSVHTDNLADGAVTTEKLADGSVTALKLGGVGARSIADGAVGASALAADSVDGARLQSHTVGTRELAPREPITYVGAPGAPPWLVATGDPGVIAFLAGDDEARAGFYKDNSGDVHLVGAFESVIVGTPAFVLPPGYRPPADMYFADRAAGAGDVLLIDTSGVVETMTQAQADPLTAPLQVLPLPDLFLLQGISWRPDQQGV